MHITFVFATGIEAQGLLDFLKKNATEKEAFKYQMNESRIDILITGIGLSQTAFSLGLYLASHKPDLLVQGGIAGTYIDRFELGSVVQVVSERFGDFGVEEADGSFLDWTDMGWDDGFPSLVLNGSFHNPKGAQSEFLPKAKGLSVQKVHGTAARIAATLTKYPDAEVETMEGAAFFSACLQTKQNFLEIRAISNKVETRNKALWDIPLALKNLTTCLEDLLTALTAKDE